MHIDFVEFSATDSAATKAFYGAAFGWTFTDYGPQYADINNAGLKGGFQSDPDEAPKAPLVVIYAHDLEGALAKVTAAGGVITAPTFSFPGGRRVQFIDPSGNELAVWSDR
jgi:predicted enzyme related to lactoylglutathione lyase